MSNDAKKLHKLVKHRNTHLEAMQEKVRKEEAERKSVLLKIRESQNSSRMKKNDEKENERKMLSRTLMAKLVSASDYPDCPPYVPHMINILKNILGS